MKDGAIRRIAAVSLERLVEASVERLIPSLANPQDAIDQVHLNSDGIEIVLHPQHRIVLREQSQSAAASDSVVTARTAASNVSTTARGLFIAVALPLRGGRASLFAGAQDGCRPDHVLIAALRKAQAMVERDDHGRAIVRTAPVSPYDRKILRLAFLAPDLQRDILAGRQPQRLMLETLIHQPIPLAWSEQRLALGWQKPL